LKNKTIRQSIFALWALFAMSLHGDIHNEDMHKDRSPRSPILQITNEYVNHFVSKAADGTLEILWSGIISVKTPTHMQVFYTVDGSTPNANSPKCEVDGTTCEAVFGGIKDDIPIQLIGIDENGEHTEIITCEPHLSVQEKAKIQEKNAKILEENKALKARAKSIVNEIVKPNMSELEKLVTIQNWVVSHAEYDKEAAKSPKGDIPNYGKAWDANTVLSGDGKVVCFGYATATKELLEAAGMEAHLATGFVTKDQNGKNARIGHAWLVVKLDGQYDHIDPTFLDTRKKADWFLRGDEFMSKDRQWENVNALGENIPSCPNDYPIDRNTLLINHLSPLLHLQSMKNVNSRSSKNQNNKNIIPENIIPKP